MLPITFISRKMNWTLKEWDITSPYMSRSDANIVLSVKFSSITAQPLMLSHPRGGPSIGFGYFCLLCKRESPPSILVTRNPNWSFRDSKARDWLRKEKVLTPLVRPT
jgi:hypothetical protein